MADWLDEWLNEERDWRAELRTAARGLSDYLLDEQLAIVAARRNVAAAHGRLQVAELFNDATLLLAEVREERAALGRAVDDAAPPLHPPDVSV